MNDCPALSDYFNRLFLLGNQVLYCIEGSVLWLEASRCLWEDTAGRLVSLTAISNANPVNLENEIWSVFQPLTDFNLFFFFHYLVGQNMSRMLNQETPPTWETVMVRISSPCQATGSETHTDTHLCTPWAQTLTPVTAPVTPPHMNLCAVLTHICIQYMASCNLCHLWGRTTDMYNYRSCSVRANGRDRKLDGRKDFPDPVCKHVPSSVPTEHDPGWASVLIRTRGVLDGSSQWTTLHMSAFYLNAKSTVLHSWCLFWILRFSSEFLLCWFPCSLNSFSVFGLYISARLQIIWRPHLWLVWSFTQMVSFLEFSTSNPVSPPSPSFISHRASLEC